MKKKKPGAAGAVKHAASPYLTGLQQHKQKRPQPQPQPQQQQPQSPPPPPPPAAVDPSVNVMRLIDAKRFTDARRAIEAIERETADAAKPSAASGGDKETATTARTTAATAATAAMWEALLAVSLRKVKLHYNGEIRVTRLSTEAAFADVEAAVRTFLGLAARSRRGVAIRYTDADGDTVTVKSTEEWADCWADHDSRKRQAAATAPPPQATHAIPHGQGAAAAAAAAS
eukprot:Rhum_TRINITY_DN7093_c0_g1::Rhum_TRINITY_DN7093_c0_g1_i1::g.21464::m.21464